MKFFSSKLPILFPLFLLAAFLRTHAEYLIGPALHLRTLAAGALPLLAFYAPARRLLARLPQAEAIPEADRFVYGLFLSFVLASGCGFALLTLRIGYPGVLIGVSALMLFLHWGWWKRQLRDVAESWSSLPSFEGWTIERVLLLLALLLALAAALLPPLGYDAHEYHLPVPQQYLKTGGWQAFPLNVYAGFPMNVEMLYLWPLASGNAAGCTVINLLFALIAALALSRLCERWNLDSYACLAAMIFLSTGMTLRLIVDANIDMALAASAAVLLLAYERYRRDGLGADAYMAAAALGFALGAKYIAILAVLLPFLSMAAMDVLLVRRWDLLRPLALILAAGLALFAPWLVRNLALYHNPFYPLLTPVFGGTPEIFADLFQAAHSPAVETGTQRITNFFAIPLQKVFGESSAALGFSCQWLLGIPPLFKTRRDHPAFRAALFLAGAYSAWFFLTQRNDRFLAPLLPLLALMAVYAFPWIQEPRAERFARAAVVLTAALQIWYASIFIITNETAGYLFAPIMETNYLQRQLPHYRAIAALNQIIEDGGQVGDVLFVGEAQTFGANFNALAPTVFNRHPLENGLPPTVTHVIYNGSELNRLTMGYGALGWPLGEMLYEWHEKSKGTILESVYDAYPEKPGLVVLYKVKK
ncbi:MAG: hypothetical protein AB1656_09520 [Candidatus Omnitrophota bacterium]